jgi:phospholipid transport system substrate-binding protein
MKSIFKCCLMAAWMVLFAAGVQANGPDVVIRDATENLLGIVGDARGYFDSDPERYYQEVDAVIGPVVDFYSFSRGVMGRWGSKAYYDSLAGDDEKQRFRAQIDRFTSVFRQGLVRTYSKGLLAFSGETIEVQPADPAEVATGVATVVQTIHAGDGKSYVIRYKMRQDGKSGWKVRNVSLDTLNLGKVYQSQFASAAGKYQGDIDQVIANWSIAPAN